MPKPSTPLRLLFSAVAVVLLFVLLLGVAGALNMRLLEQRNEWHLTQAPSTENMPPGVAFTTVALGGFRGILADILWMRAGAIQEEGRYFELVQLADWISKLQPRSPVIWSYQAWNMAYNISVLMADPAERWRWVYNGLRLLRDEGMAYNPGSAALHQELAWMFLHKLGTDMDTAAAYYREQWAAIADEENQRLAPDSVKEITALFPALDWHTPQAQAIYWAYTGLPFVRNDFEDLQLRRIIYQALFQCIQNGNYDLLEDTARFLKETQERHPAAAPLPDLIEMVNQLWAQFKAETGQP